MKAAGPKKKRQADDEIAQVGTLESSAIVGEVDYEEELKELRRKQAAAYSNIPLDARRDIANKTKERRSAVVNNTVGIDREEDDDLDLLSLAPMVNEETRRYITAKEFKAITIDEEKSTALNHKILLGKGQLAFTAEGQDIEAPEKGYVKETIVKGKFIYEVIPGSEDSPTKIYKIEVLRLVDGKHSTTAFDTMYFNAKNEIVGLDEATVGKSQLDLTWLKEKKVEYAQAMEEEEVLETSGVNVSTVKNLPKSTTLRNTLSEVRRELDAIEDSEFKEAINTREGSTLDNDKIYSDTSSVSPDERQQVEAAAMRFKTSKELKISRSKAFEKLKALIEDREAEFTVVSVKQLEIVLKDPAKMNKEEIQIVRKALAEGKKELLDAAHLITSAAENQHLEAVEALVKAGVDVNVLNSEGKTALDYTNINIAKEEKINESKGFFGRLWDKAQAAALPLDDHKTSNELILDVLVENGAKASEDIRPVIFSIDTNIPLDVGEKAKRAAVKDVKHDPSAKKPVIPSKAQNDYFGPEF